MKMYTVVYADILLAINWIIDYFLLVCTAALAGHGASRWRLLFGGALGGASAFIFLAPAMPLWLQLGYQLLTGTVILLAAFRLRVRGLRLWLRQFFRLWFWYFLLNLGYGGLVLAAMYWLSVTGVYHNNLAFYYDVPPLLLVGCILAMYALLRLVLLLFERPQPDTVVRVSVQAAERRLEAEVLVDTGFAADDVLLGHPVLLLSWPDTLGAAHGKRGGILPTAGDLQAGLAAYFSTKTGSAPILTPPLRLIPLHTAAGGVLVPALTADAVINGRAARVTLAFSDQRFRAGRVQGLFGAKSYQMMGGC